MRFVGGLCSWTGPHVHGYYCGSRSESLLRRHKLCAPGQCNEHSRNLHCDYDYSQPLRSRRDDSRRHVYD